MKLVIIHGDNTQKSYERLQKYREVAKKRGWNVKVISDSKTDLTEALVSGNLFGEESLFIIEGADLINKKNSKWLKENHKKIDANIVLYHKSTITKIALNLLPKPEKIEEFKLPKLIWNFLDSIYPGNAKNVIHVLREVTKTEPVEFAFSLIGKHIRDLYWAKESPSTIPYPSWRAGKLKRQAEKFEEDQLEELIEELADADIKSKTSKQNLSDLLDFIFATKLE